VCIFSFLYSIRLYPTLIVGVGFSYAAPMNRFLIRVVHAAVVIMVGVVRFGTVRVATVAVYRKVESQYSHAAKNIAILRRIVVESYARN